jgi:hypothetical protein
MEQQKTGQQQPAGPVVAKRQASDEGAQRELQQAEQQTDAARAGVRHPPSRKQHPGETLASGGEPGQKPPPADLRGLQHQRRPDRADVAIKGGPHGRAFARRVQYRSR